MAKSLLFHYYDAGAYDGETEHRIMVSFYSGEENGNIRIGQSELVLASKFPAYRDYLLEKTDWRAASPYYARRV